MGQAKRRGTEKERIAEAVARQREIDALADKLGADALAFSTATGLVVQPLRIQPARFVAVDLDKLRDAFDAMNAEVMRLGGADQIAKPVATDIEATPPADMSAIVDDGVSHG